MPLHELRAGTALALPCFKNSNCFSEISWKPILLFLWYENKKMATGGFVRGSRLFIEQPNVTTKKQILHCDLFVTDYTRLHPEFHLFTISINTYMLRVTSMSIKNLDNS